jgi:cephalosporin hydroxylase
LELNRCNGPVLTSDHNKNPDVRPLAQNIRNEEGAFSQTPPIPRDFKTAFPPQFLTAYHRGVMNYTYKGVSCLKSPIDLALYMLLIYELRPRTFVEIGSFHGGAALFYADVTGNYGLDTTIITVDFRDLQELQGDRHRHERVEFIQANAMDLANSRLNDRLKSCARPWLVIEDSAHTYSVTLAVMSYFRSRMQAGEYLIIEDGVIEDQGGNWRYDGGPNRAVNKFFLEYPDAFEIDTKYNDFFGRNASFNPNGYLRKRPDPI